MIDLRIPAHTSKYSVAWNRDYPTTVSKHTIVTNYVEPLRKKKNVHECVFSRDGDMLFTRLARHMAKVTMH